MTVHPLMRQLEEARAKHPAPESPRVPTCDETTGEVFDTPPPRPARGGADRAPRMGVVAGGRPAKKPTKGASYVNQANAVRYKRSAWLVAHMGEMTEGEKTIAFYLTHLGGWSYRGSLTELGKPVGMLKPPTWRAVKGLCRLGFLVEERTKAGKLRGWAFVVK